MLGTMAIMVEDIKLVMHTQYIKWPCHPSWGESALFTIGNGKPREAYDEGSQKHSLKVD